MRQRNLANSRERKRMTLINEGFELLKNKLPLMGVDHTGELCYNMNYLEETHQFIVTRKSRLTKSDILRLAIEYIKHLSCLLDNGRPYPTDDQQSGIKFKTLRKNLFRQRRNSVKISKINKKRSENRQQAKPIESPKFSPDTKQSSTEMRIVFHQSRDPLGEETPKALQCLLSWAWRRRTSAEDLSSRINEEGKIGSQLWIPELVPARE